VFSSTGRDSFSFEFFAQIFSVYKMAQNDGEQEKLRQVSAKMPF